MYLKNSNTSTRRLVIRELDGERLDEPLVIKFNEEGLARCKADVGKRVADIYDSIEVHRDETESNDNEED